MEKPTNLSAKESATFWEYGSVFPEVASLCVEISRLREAMAKISCGLARAAFADGNDFMEGRNQMAETEMPVFQPIAKPEIAPAPVVKAARSKRSYNTNMFAVYDVCCPKNSRRKYLQINQSLYNIISNHGSQNYYDIAAWFKYKGWRREYLVEAMASLSLKRQGQKLVATKIPLPLVIDWNDISAGKSQQDHAVEVCSKYVKHGEVVDMTPAFEQLFSVGVRISEVYSAIRMLNGKKGSHMKDRHFEF